MSFDLPLRMLLCRAVTWLKPYTSILVTAMNELYNLVKDSNSPALTLFQRIEYSPNLYKTHLE